MHLDGLVNDHLRHVGRDDFDLRDLAFGALHADGIHQPRGLEREQPRLLDGHARVGDDVAIAAQHRQRLAEGDARERPLAHELQGPFGGADDAHAMVDAARTQPPLSDLKTAARPADEVIQRHAHIRETHFAVAVGLV